MVNIMAKNDGIGIVFNRPNIIPVDLISREELERLLKEKKFGTRTRYYMVGSNGDQKYCSHDGRLCFCSSNYSEWGISGRVFEEWLKGLEYHKKGDGGEFGAQGGGGGASRRMVIC